MTDVESEQLRSPETPYEFLGEARAESLLDHYRSEITDEDIINHFPNDSWPPDHYSSYGWWRANRAQAVVDSRLENLLVDPELGASVADYFSTFELGFFSSNYATRKWTATQYANILRVGVQKLITDNPAVEEEFMSRALAFNRHLKEADYWHRSHYLRWRNLVVKNAALEGFDNHIINVAISGSNPELAESLLQPGDSRSIWRKIHMQTKTHTDRYAYSKYILGPDIAAKETTELLQVLNDAEQNDAIEALDLPPSAARWAYDSFRTLLSEASAAGWANAGKLDEALEAMPKRDVESHSIIIHLSNLITEPINRSVNGEIKLKKLRPPDIENTEEAINRCLYVIFELGQQPKERDPINYLILGEIIARIFKASHPQTATGQEQNSYEKQANQVKDMRQASRSDRIFWTKWKASYGIFS